MYSVGDVIVYPMHGAGVIEEIEEREILGAVQKYYVMNISYGNMRVMLPMNNASKIGIRDVISGDEADEVISRFSFVEPAVNSNWNKRIRENMEKIKSGDINEVAVVVKSLMMRDRQKGLSTSERKMLSNAKQIFISELVLAKKTTNDEIERELSSIVDRQLKEA